MRHFLNLTHPQARAVAIIKAMVIWSLTFIAGYEWAHLFDWLVTGESIYD